MPRVGNVLEAHVKRIVEPGPGGIAGGGRTPVKRSPCLLCGGGGHPSGVSSCSVQNRSYQGCHGSCSKNHREGKRVRVEVTQLGTCPPPPPPPEIDPFEQNYENITTTTTGGSHNISRQNLAQQGQIKKRESIPTSPTSSYIPTSPPLCLSLSLSLAGMSHQSECNCSDIRHGKGGSTRHRASRPSMPALSTIPTRPPVCLPPTLSPAGLSLRPVSTFRTIRPEKGGGTRHGTSRPSMPA